MWGKLTLFHCGKSIERSIWTKSVPESFLTDRLTTNKAIYS